MSFNFESEGFPIAKIVREGEKGKGKKKKDTERQKDISKKR